MAYIFMRNVRHVLQPIASISTASFQNHAKRVQVGSLKRLLNFYPGQYSRQVNFSSSILLNNLAANSTDVSTVVDSTTPTTDNLNPKTKKNFQFNTAKTKEAHLKRFNHALIKGIQYYIECVWEGSCLDFMFFMSPRFFLCTFFHPPICLTVKL